jgi:hypothetical protein
MSFFSNFTSFFKTTEADVINFASKVWHEVPVLEAEIVQVSNWVIGEIPVLTAAIAAATPIVDAVGGVADPTIAVKMAALNAAMAGLNNFAASAKANTLTADQVVKGYSSLKSATSAASSVVSTAANIIAITPAQGSS